MTPSSIYLAILYAAASAAALLSLRQSSDRNKRLIVPMLLNFAAAIGIVIFAILYPCKLLALNPFGVSHQEFFVALLLVSVCAVCVEVPGFLLNLAYDKKKEDALQNITDLLLDVRLSPTENNRRKLQDSAEAGRAILDENHLGSFISKCADEFLKLGNADTALLNILTDQVRREQSKVSERSKHPFPVLIQLLGLSSVVFVLAEILAILRTR